MLKQNEIGQTLLPREGVMTTLVVENTEGKVTDFISYYSIPIKINDNSKYETINVAYLYQYCF